MPVTCKCRQCGAEFQAFAAWIKRGGGKFCSRTCSELGKSAPPKRSPPDVRFWAKVEKSDGCWLWTARVDKLGYGFFRADSQKAHALAHRFSWALHNGPIPTGLLVLHKCDRPGCVRPDHLYVGTDADNTADKLSRHRQAHRLSTEQVQAIRERLRAGATRVCVAADYNVTTSAIRLIAVGRTWAWLKPAESAAQASDPA